jgi:hypothetical protein
MNAGVGIEGSKDRIRVGDLRSRSSKIGSPKVLKDNIRVLDLGFKI